MVVSNISTFKYFFQTKTPTIKTMTRTMVREFHCCKRGDLEQDTFVSNISTFRYLPDKDTNDQNNDKNDGKCILLWQDG